MTDTITVVAVDDHPLILHSARTLLEAAPGMALVAEGSAGEDVLRLVEQHRPDILLLDLSMPRSAEGPSSERFQALPTLDVLTDRFPDTAVIILTQQFVPVIIRGAIERGVRGYLLKGDDLSLGLPTAVELVSKGGVYFSETISSELFRRSQQSSTVSLTRRQIDVLTAIANEPNLSYDQHAANLGISDSTFRNHLTKAFKALGVQNITAAIIRCMELGLISVNNL